MPYFLKVFLLCLTKYQFQVQGSGIRNAARKNESLARTVELGESLFSLQQTTICSYCHRHLPVILVDVGLYIVLWDVSL